jgi:hypothetical protein
MVSTGRRICLQRAGPNRVGWGLRPNGPTGRRYDIRDIRLDMARLRARFKVATDEEVEDILMEYGVLRDSEPGDWVCAGRCLMAFEPGEVESKRQV